MLLALSFAATLAVPNQVFIVDAQGTGDFLDLPAAVQAAASGDVLLVREGEYTGFSVTGMGLSSQAHPDAMSPPKINGVVLLNQVPLAETFLLDGFEIEAGPYDYYSFEGSPVQILASPGSVRLQDCTAQALASDPFVFGQAAVRVSQSSDVAVTDSTLIGGDILASLGYAAGELGESGGDALTTFNSTVAVHRSILRGGEGGDLPNGGLGGYGGRGANVQFGRVHFSQCFLRAGPSGDTGDGVFFGSCTDGSPGLRVSGASARVTHLGTTLIGGEPGAYITAPCSGGGQPGAPFEGNVREIQGMPRALQVAGTVVAGTPVVTSYRGQAGDLAVRLVSTHSAWAWRPMRKGALLIDTQLPALLQIQGVLGGGGSLDVTETFALPAGMESFTLYLQGLFVGTDGGTTLANPRAMTILDSSL